MFNELVESVAVRQTTNKGWGILISVALQSVSVIALVLVPLFYTEALPKALLGSLLVASPSPAPSAGPPTVATTATRRSVRLFDHNQLREPRGFPQHAAIFVEPELAPETRMGAGGTGDEGDIDLLSGLTETSGRAIPAPPAPPPVKTPQRIQQGGTIQAARIINQTRPIYPVLAIQARIQGNVVLHAIIDKQGLVSELQVISGDPRLVKAALDAVTQWRYQPTSLNGQPVEVDTTITVSFVLGE